MAGIFPKGAVVYHIFSENPKVAQTFASCTSIFSFQKEIGKTDILKSKFQFAMSYSRTYRNSHGADIRAQGMRSGGHESYNDGSEMSKELDQTGQQTNNETSSRQQRY